MLVAVNLNSFGRAEKAKGSDNVELSAPQTTGWRQALSVCLEIA